MNDNKQDPIPIVEIEVKRYCTECPNCGDWWEHELSQRGKGPFQCVECRTWMKAEA